MSEMEFILEVLKIAANAFVVLFIAVLIFITVRRLLKYELPDDISAEFRTAVSELEAVNERMSRDKDVNKKYLSDSDKSIRVLKKFC